MRLPRRITSSNRSASVFMINPAPLGADPFASLGPPTLQHGPSVLGCHPGTKAMDPGPLYFFGLVSSFHPVRNRKPSVSVSGLKLSSYILPRLFSLILVDCPDR